MNIKTYASCPKTTQFIKNQRYLIEWGLQGPGVKILEKLTTWFVYGPKDGIIKILEKTPFEIIYAPDTLQIVDDPSVRAAVGEFMKCPDQLYCTL